MSKCRYAVFFNDERDKKWAVIGEMRFFGFWSEFSTTYYDTEDQATHMRDMWAAEESRRRINRGIQSSEWRP